MYCGISSDPASDKGMGTSFLTLRQRGVDEIIINKSRFLGYATPVSTEEEAQAFIREIRHKHRDASHNCYAYTIGKNMGIMRYSDDGEPSGTAGLPMMEVIKKEQVCNCCCVVTRYFGGVLLGAGGLLRAYTQGCSIGLHAAQIVEMIPTVSLLCEVSYSLWDKVAHHLATMPVQIVHPEFTTAVSWTLLVREKDLKQVSEQLILLTDSRITLLEDELTDMPWDLE